MKHLVVRVDANAAVGSGHAIRCLALAQAWRRQGGFARFATADLPPGLEREIAVRGFDVERLAGLHPDPSDAAGVVNAATSVGGRGWIVIDGYGFTPDYHRRVRAAGWPILVVDDNSHLDYYDADVLLNQNIGADSLDYRGRPQMRLLLGTEYTLLRQEFIESSPASSANGSVSHVLVLMGGGDPDNVTNRVLRSMAAMTGRPSHIRVVVGPSNPHRENIASVAADIPGVEVIQSPRDMSAVMRWADLAVTAAGSTCWELAYLGVPMITLVIADNQRGIADGLASRGASVNLGWHDSVTAASIGEAVSRLAADDQQRASMRRTARALVDGRGAERVVAELVGN